MREMEDKRIKIGVIGTGGIFEGWGGDSGHLPAYPWIIEEAKIVSLCDINERNLKKADIAFKRLFKEKADSFKERGDTEISDLLVADSEGIKLYTSLDEMLKAERFALKIKEENGSKAPDKLREELLKGIKGGGEI